MRVVVQRVRYARVRVGERVVAEIEHGLLLFVGFKHDDAEPDLTYMADKVVHLR
ncbi:MAG: D-aminoacyl-tRNA deacylase, partial [Firmicutes bacterium]|nr:D-aminoacyl-tRNA deacylase [Bacillota bacterium]